MFRIDHSTAAVAIPTPGAAGTPGYFTEGNPGTGTAATVVTADWANMVQEELMEVILAASLTPSKTTRTQLLSAIQALTRGRLLDAVTTQNTVYSRVTTADTAWADVAGFTGSIANTAGNARIRAHMRAQCWLTDNGVPAGSPRPTSLRLLVNGGGYTDAVVDRCQIEGLATGSFMATAILSGTINVSVNTTYAFKLQAKASGAGESDCRFNASEDSPSGSDPDAMSALVLELYSR